MFTTKPLALLSGRCQNNSSLDYISAWHLREVFCAFFVARLTLSWLSIMPQKQIESQGFFVMRRHFRYKKTVETRKTKIDFVLLDQVAISCLVLWLFLKRNYCATVMFLNSKIKKKHTEKHILIITKICGIHKNYFRKCLFGLLLHFSDVDFLFVKINSKWEGQVGHNLVLTL